MSNEDGVVKLPEAPEGTQFEELVAAALQSSGLFVEKNLEEYLEYEGGKDQVLELDVITTSYEDEVPQLTLVEAKSGGWGFKDIFKVKGWMDYLDIPKGMLIVADSEVEREGYKEVCDELNVSIVTMSEDENYRQVISDVAPDMGNVLEIDVSSWRFYYWAERELINVAKKRRYDEDKGETYSFKISDYADAISNDIFFADNITSRINRLYNSHSEYRNLAARTGYEMKEGEFPDTADKIPGEIYKRTVLGHEVNSVQTALMLEQQARVSLLKAAVEYSALEEAGEKVGPTVKITIEDEEFTFPVYKFPETFERAIEDIRGNDNYLKYPVFWKFFTGIFGGFILKDYLDEEYKHLSELTGVPVEEIPEAMDAFSKFFPLPDGSDWIVDFKYTSIKGLRLFPTPLRGIGANYRRLLYTEEASYTDLELTGRHTLDDLLTWNRSAYKLVSGEYAE